MPAIFTPEQRDELKRSIKQNALRYYGEKGIRKTTVSELAASVGIAKGTFYNFYTSKGELTADILKDFDRISEAKLREQLQKNGRIHIDKLFELYMNIFRPETAFSFHFTPDDIRWMQETDETKYFFDPEYGIRTAKLLLDNVDGIRSDIDYPYIVNFAKLINIAIENRDSFCKSAFQDNLDSLMKLMADHLRGEG